MNVAASKLANAQIFREANDQLDAFCRDTGWEYGIFIEHAMGLAEGTRNRWHRDRTRALDYHGFDYGEMPVTAAIAAQAAGELPPQARFVRADIADPDAVIDAIGAERMKHQGAVMVVSAGFHEVRGQTNESMVLLFRRYADLNTILIINETPRLTDEQKRDTAYSTYQAAFDWVHGTSGQTLRPYTDSDDPAMPASWRTLLDQAGYVVVKRYSVGDRTIYPSPLPEDRNPPISYTYFCVPKALAERLHLV